MPCLSCQKTKRKSDYQKKGSEIEQNNEDGGEVVMKHSGSHHEEYREFYESTIVTFRDEYEVIISGPRRLKIDSFDL